jgi:hypothetical protein
VHSDTVLPLLSGTLANDNLSCFLACLLAVKQRITTEGQREVAAYAKKEEDARMAMEGRLRLVETSQIVHRTHTSERLALVRRDFVAVLKRLQASLAHGKLREINAILKRRAYKIKQDL